VDISTLVTLGAGLAGILGFVYLLLIGQKSLVELWREKKASKSIRKSNKKTSAKIPSADASSWSLINADFQLLVIEGTDKGKTFLMNRLRMTIGRSSLADIQFSERNLSRNHFSITWDPDKKVHFLEDWGHPNRITINGEVIKAHSRVTLKVGDEIGLGNTLLRYERTH